MYINKFYPGRSFPLDLTHTSLRDTEDEFCFHQKWIELILGDEIRWERKQNNSRKQNDQKHRHLGHLGHLGFALGPRNC